MPKLQKSNVTVKKQTAKYGKKAVKKNWCSYKTLIS